MHPFLLLHLWIAALFLVPIVWNSAMVGPSGAAIEYWEATKDSPLVQNHPHLDPTTWDNVIPLGMHGDAGSFAHHDSLFCFLDELSSCEREYQRNEIRYDTRAEEFDDTCDDDRNHKDFVLVV